MLRLRTIGAEKNEGGNYLTHAVIHICCKQ